MSDQRSNPAKLCTCGFAEGDGNPAPVLDVRCPQHGTATPSPSLHEEHIRRARTWWNLQDYRQTPEASVEGIATLLDEAYDLGQRMGHPRPPTDGYRAAMWDDAIEAAALEAERMIVEFSEIDVVDSAPEKERIARRIRALRSKYAEPATSEPRPCCCLEAFRVWREEHSSDRGCCEKAYLEGYTSGRKQRTAEPKDKT